MRTVIFLEPEKLYIIPNNYMQCFYFTNEFLSHDVMVKIHLILLLFTH